ncbi:peptidase, partial [Pseudomonas sp. GW247-3R2A]
PLATASLLAIAISLAGCGEGKDKNAATPTPAASTAAAPAAAPAATSKVDEAAAKAVVAHYADIVYAVYSDAESTAKTLQTAVDAFLAKPNADTLKAAKAAWV